MLNLHTHTCKPHHTPSANWFVQHLQKSFLFFNIFSLVLFAILLLKFVCLKKINDDDDVALTEAAVLKI